MPNCKLVSIIGVDCAGKSTQVERLMNRYNRMGVMAHSVRLIEKPSVKHLEHFLNRLGSNDDSLLGPLCGDHFAIAYCCDFYNHYCDNIAPEIDSEKCEILLSDRYVACYKAFAHAVGAVNEISYSFLDLLVRPPDLQLCLDVDISVVLSRMAARKGERSRDETPEILESLIAYYRDFAKHDSRTVLIEADKEVSLLTDELFRAVERVRND